MKERVDTGCIQLNQCIDRQTTVKFLNHLGSDDLIKFQ